MTNDVRVRASLADNVSSPLAKIKDGFGSAFGSKLTKNLTAANLASMAVAKGFSLVGSAVSGVTDFLAAATQAAIADEQSISRLDSALRANVEGWDGNREAIEKVLAARMDLGFSDDEQRDSLALLTVATKDASKALEIQRVAMDLARLKGIDLRTASEALIKVEGGQFRALKALGIELRDGATATEALAAVTKAARGQAEAFAKTSGGRLLVAQTKLGEAMERIGNVILPAVAAGADLAADALDEMGEAADSLGALASGSADAEEAAFDLMGTLRLIPAWVNPAAHAFGELAEEQLTARRAMKHMASASKDDLVPGLVAIEEASDDVTSAFDRVQQAVRDADKAFDDYTDTLFGADIAAGDLAEAKRDLDDLLKEGPESQSAADTAIYAGKVAEAEARVLELERAVATLAGDESLYAWLQKQQAGLAGMTTKAQAAYWALRATALAGLTTAPVSFINDYMDRIDRLLGAGEARAHGGPVTAGRPYVVGEEGPELFVPRASGDIVPNGGSATGGGTSSTPSVIQLVVDGRVLAEVVNRHNSFARSRGSFAPV